MTPAIHDSGFSLSDSQVNEFAQKGYTILRDFLAPETVQMLHERLELELRNAPQNFQEEFSRLKYDFETSKDMIYELIGRPFFQETLYALTNRSLFFTFEICFELEKCLSQGFPWHVGVQSFGYQRSEDFGCTIWVPLDPIEPAGQGGGMAYVPKCTISGRFMYDDIEPAVVSTLDNKIARGEPVTLEDYFDLRTGVLNSPAFSELLTEHRDEDAFSVGDVWIFDKYVIHRSVPLGEGPLSRRRAFVLRFIDINSRYDLQRARNLEYPADRFGYKAFTRSHIDVAKNDGQLLSTSEYFDRPELRVISSQRE